MTTMRKSTKTAGKIDINSGLRITVDGKQCYEHELPKGMLSIADQAMILSKRLQAIKQMEQDLEEQKSLLAIDTMRYKMDQGKAFKACFDVSGKVINAEMTDDKKKIRFYDDTESEKSNFQELAELFDL